jgi:hypothetical protein
MMVQQEPVCCTINRDGSDGCRIGFLAREYAARENGRRLDGVIVQITEVFTPDHDNHYMQCLYHHNHGYVYAIVLFHAT